MLKEAEKKIEELTKSKDGNKWGRKWLSTTGEKVSFTEEQNNSLYSDVKEIMLKYEKRGVKTYYKKIISMAESRYNIIISRSFLTKFKKRLNSLCSDNGKFI